MAAQEKYSSKYAEAIDYANSLHAGQLRKGTSIPYLSHLLSVSALVIEDGGDETQAIAALLHDAAEDAGGEQALSEMRDRFGDEVAEIVRACSDALPEEGQDKPPWIDRKLAHVAHVDKIDRAAARVIAADKLHNARSILVDYRALYDELWERFNAPPALILWYHNAMLGKLRERLGNSRTVRELDLVVGELYRETGVDRPRDPFTLPGASAGATR